MITTTGGVWETGGVTGMTLALETQLLTDNKTDSEYVKTWRNNQRIFDAISETFDTFQERNRLTSFSVIQPFSLKSHWPELQQQQTPRRSSSPPSRCIPTLASGSYPGSQPSAVLFVFTSLFSLIPLCTGEPVLLLLSLCLSPPASPAALHCLQAVQPLALIRNSVKVICGGRIHSSLIINVFYTVHNLWPDV